MRPYPVVLSIAGSDCSGGAGIQADIKTISALGGYAASVITAITVQNTLGVQRVEAVSPETVYDQIEAVMSDLQPDAIKIGMVNDVATIRMIAVCLQKHQPRFVVYDPVMVSTSGHLLMTTEAIQEIKEVLFPLTTLITPNLNEVAVLCARSVTSPEEMLHAAQELATLYQTSILVKGGHLPGEDMCDVLYSADDKSAIYKGKKIESRNLHGTGCTLSSAIATQLAKGNSSNEAIREAKRYIEQAIAAGRDLNIGQGNGPLWHFPDSMHKSE